MRQANAPDYSARTRNLHGSVVRQCGPYAFKHGVGTVTISHFQYLGYSLVATFLHEIGGTEFACDTLAVGMAAHGNDAGGAHQLGGQHSAQADRTVAEHDCGVSRLDFGGSSRMVTGRHHVREGEQRCEHFVGEALRVARNNHQRAIGLGNAQVFCLAAQSLVSEISAVGAAGFETGLAYRALAAAERERYDHEIARLGHGHVVADLLDHADGLMSGLSVGFLAAVAVEPQVGSAHACAYHADDGISPIDDGRFGMLFACHLLDSLEDRCLHELLLCYTN